MSQWIAWNSINNDWNTWHNTTDANEISIKFYFETNIIDLKRAKSVWKSGSFQWIKKHWIIMLRGMFIFIDS